MEWVDLVTPALAVIGVFLGVGLIVQSIRHSRAIRRLEDRMAGAGVAAADAPLQRLQELQQRVTTSSARVGLGGRTALISVAALVAVLALAAGAWAVFLRDSGNGTAGGRGVTTPGTTTTGRTTSQAAADPNLCKSITPLEDNALVTVTIFNASGVEGAARTKVQPAIDIKGYTRGLLTNPPDDRNDLQKTVVQYVKAADRNAACSVARDLEITPLKVTPLEGFSADQVGGDNVNVVVLVGLDLANG
ncbi:MAG: LytR C-terminal domain-containing protein [Thermoleophilia bacterium]|nr:LytR C-terminal domain-containing protein [Thermoleophilia bacterium]